MFDFYLGYVDGELSVDMVNYRSVELDTNAGGLISGNSVVDSGTNSNVVVLDYNVMYAAVVVNSLALVIGGSDAEQAMLYYSRAMAVVFHVAYVRTNGADLLVFAINEGHENLKDTD